MEIQVVSKKVSKEELRRLGKPWHDRMIKAVVDVKKEILAIGGELHSDAEALLLDRGSKQEDLWGVNLYPDNEENGRIEYTSLINIRPRQGNRAIEIQDTALRKQIREIVDRRIDWRESR